MQNFSREHLLFDLFQEQAKIAKLGLEMKLITSEMDAETDKWEEPDNDIVKRAKNMSSMAFSMYLFTRGEGPLKTTQDLFIQAEYFSEEGTKLYKTVRDFSDKVMANWMLVGQYLMLVLQYLIDDNIAYNRNVPLFSDWFYRKMFIRFLIVLIDTCDHHSSTTDDVSSIMYRKPHINVHIVCEFVIYMNDMYAISKMYVLYVNLSFISVTCLPSPYSVTVKHSFSNYLFIIMTNSPKKKSVSFHCS